MATPYHQGPPSANISRLLTAAVVNKGFCKLLLSNPQKAISSGYNGENFRLDHQEEELVLSIHATSLPDFANKITCAPAEDSKSKFHPGQQRQVSFIL